MFRACLRLFKDSSTDLGSHIFPKHPPNSGNSPGILPLRKRKETRTRMPSPSQRSDPLPPPSTFHRHTIGDPPNCVESAKPRSLTREYVHIIPSILWMACRCMRQFCFSVTFPFPFLPSSPCEGMPRSNPHVERFSSFARLNNVHHADSSPAVLQPVTNEPTNSAPRGKIVCTIFIRRVVEKINLWPVVSRGIFPGII